jgi:hypothetical protein
MYQGETRVLNPRPKLLGFHMSGPATLSHAVSKEAWGREEKGKFQDKPWEEADYILSPSLAVFGVQT